MWGLAQTHVAGPMRPGMILPQCADEKKTVSGPHELPKNSSCVRYWFMKRRTAFHGKALTKTGEKRLCVAPCFHACFSFSFHVLTVKCLLTLDTDNHLTDAAKFLKP